MTTTHETTRVKIERLLRDNPRQSAAELARQAGVTRQRAQQILEDSGYELVVYWRKKR